MSASAAAASSTLARSRAAVLGIATLTTICIGYYAWRQSDDWFGTGPPAGAGLHRSNAIHRRRRRNTNVADDASIFVDDEAENDGEGHPVARTLTDGDTVIDDQAFQEEYAGWATLPESHQRNGQNIVQLLFRVSEDATRRTSYVHRGCACNSCGVLPIRGIRYRCANCPDYDLCEGCESQGLHIKTHIFYKVRVPAPNFGARCIQPVWYSGDPDTVMRTLPKEILAKLSRETGFERPELDAYWEQWTFMANTDYREDPDDINLAMDRKTFERSLVPSGGSRYTAPSLIFDRMFAFYDTNKDDLISFPEFLHGLGYRKKKDKWRRVFEGYDIDGDGYVDRRDFLRMFRSYYVLYRQMHRDMLEGTEEQQMTSSEAHRLVSGRQPLSSAFGQDGRYPRAPDPRTGEGKVTRASGDQDIVDGKGIINESGNDHGNREELFRRNVPSITRSHWEGEMPSDGAAYLAAVLNPPSTIEQMPDVLRNLRRIRGQVANILRDEPDTYSGPRRVVVIDADDSDSDRSSFGSDSDLVWPPSYVTVTDEDAEAVAGPGIHVEDVPRTRRKAVIAHAIYRERAQREIYERWQRRHFYTDEEEGAVPPADWKDDDDILVQSGITGESSKSPSRPVIRSRSSSKVRFAEDMDDFDTRSNPSTSSRSVPERWGGIDIPDAERDAGKEILFQVTQQAFNELLDPLFKEREDMAVEAAATKTDREKYRHLFSTPRFEQWASEKASSISKPKESIARKPETMTTNPVWPNFQEVEFEQVRERPLEELLEATGYQIDGDHGAVEMPALEPAFIADTETNAHEDAQTSPPLRENFIRPDTPDFDTVESRPSDTPTEGLSTAAQYNSDGDSRSPLSTPPHSATLPTTPEYRDPTFPQFRPNSVPDLEMQTPSFYATPDEAPLPNDNINSEDSAETLSPSKENQPPQPSSSQSPSASNAASSTPTNLPKPLKEKHPSELTLYKLWKIDRAAKEAEKQGGWGRLSFVEFETSVKRFVLEGKGLQMDYLGSWIDFCIPS